VSHTANPGLRGLAASAWATGPAAVHDAVAQAVAGLGGTAPALVLAFPDAELPRGEVLAQAAGAAPDCPVAGMTSRGLITGDGVRPSGCAATAFADEVAVGIGLAREASRDPRAAGRAAVEQAVAGLDLAPGRAVLLLFLDPESGDAADVIDGAYSVVGGRVPLAGGGANGRAPAVLADDAMSADAVAAVALSCAAPVAVGLGHGCRRRGEPAIATRTAGRVLGELDGRPAEEVYLEGLGRAGERLDDRAFEALAVLHPLAQPELRGLFRLRHVLRRAPGGGLLCATAIPPNAAVFFTEQTAETIVASAGSAVDEALAPLGPPRAALVFDCAARQRALGERLPDEGEALVAALGGVPAVAGLFTRGEVGRMRGSKGDRNHAVVVVAFA
jgi:hypothetical protein